MKLFSVGLYNEKMSISSQYGIPVFSLAISEFRDNRK